MTRIDPRGPRFGAAVTSVVLAIALLVPLPGALLAAGLQWLVFAIGAFVGLQHQPWGVLFRRVVRPRLGPPEELEDPRAPRFAQLVGFGFVSVALIGVLLGWDGVYYLAIGAALLAACSTLSSICASDVKCMCASPASASSRSALCVGRCDGCG